MKTTRKKMLAALVAALMITALLGGCSGSASGSSQNRQPASSSQAESQFEGSSTQSFSSEADSEAQHGAEEQAKGQAIMNLGALKGPTGIGMVEIMERDEKKESKNDYNFTLAGAPDEISGKLLKGELDVAALPTNLAAVLYEKTGHKISLLAVNTLGVLYILTKGEEIASMADLRGKTIYSTGQGTTQEYVLNYLLNQNGIDPVRDVTIEYKSEHAELATLLMSGGTSIALLPQPFVTTVTTRDPEVKVALDVTAEWKKAGGTDLPMGCIVARNEYLEQEPQAVGDFLLELEASVQFVNAQPAQAAELVAKFGIIENKEIAEKAIPACNIVFVAGEDAKKSVSAYLDALHAQDPKAVGGQVPQDGFYYAQS